MGDEMPTRRARALKRAIVRRRRSKYTRTLFITGEARFEDGMLTIYANPEGPYTLAFQVVGYSYEIPEYLKRHLARRK